MHKLILSSIAAAAMAMGAPAVLAASRPLYQWKTQHEETVCGDLMQQFQDAMSVRPDTGKTEKARKVDLMGKQECNSGHYRKGVATMKDALNDLHLKPARSPMEAMD